MTLMKHTDTQYDAGLSRLQGTLSHMGTTIESMLAKSIEALNARNSALVDTVVSQDETVDQLEITTDAQCIELLALHQPMASDLRFITIALRASKDLERMGDLAVNIAYAVLDLNQLPPLAPPHELQLMTHAVPRMVRDALASFVARDSAKARAVCKADDDVDRWNKTVRQNLVTTMEGNRDTIRAATIFIELSNQLERVADHATNVAEEVIYLVEGTDIRHQHAE